MAHGLGKRALVMSCSSKLTSCLFLGAPWDAMQQAQFLEVPNTAGNPWSRGLAFCKWIGL